MNRRIWLGLCIAALLLFSGCGPKVMIPPKVDLTRYRAVGIIGFGCNAEGNLGEYAMRRFLMTTRAYQKEVDITDLGTEEEILQNLRLDQMDAEAVRAIGERYKVDAVFTGGVEVIEVWPLYQSFGRGDRPVSGKTQIRGKRANAMVKAWIGARLSETEAGGTVWRASAQGEELVHRVNFLSDGRAVFDSKNQPEDYWGLVSPMVKEICDDFKIKFVRVEEN